MNEEVRPKDDALAKAQQVIDQQAAELEDLRRQLQSEQFARHLREALTLVTTTGILASPVSYTRLLEMIVEAAAHVTSAQSAALFLIDYDKEELSFAVALGQKADAVKKKRIPLGHGIAGLVAITGQPMAVSDAQGDKRQASDIASEIGYAPRNILCMPLFYNDQVIGVLEMMDKAAASSFGANDIEALELFARQAAVAIEQSRLHLNLLEMLIELVSSSGEIQSRDLREQAHQLVKDLQLDPNYYRSQELAGLVQQIASRGEEEFKACQTILQGFTTYLQAKPEFGAELRKSF